MTPRSRKPLADDARAIRMPGCGGWPAKRSRIAAATQPVDDAGAAAGGSGSVRGVRGAPGAGSGCRPTSGKNKVLVGHDGADLPAGCDRAAWPRRRRTKLAIAVLDALRSDAPRQRRPDRHASRARLSEAEFRDTLRVIATGAHPRRDRAADVPTLDATDVLKKYPTADALANRELVQLLVYLQPPEAAARAGRAARQRTSPRSKSCRSPPTPRGSRPAGTRTEKLVMLRYFETVRGVEGGHSVNGYIENFARDFFTNLTLDERRQVIAAGENFPTSALSILAKLPENAGPDVLAEMRALDERLDGMEGESIARLRVGLDGRARRERRAGVAGVSARSVSQRARAPLAGGDESHAASGRRELGRAGRFAADDRRHRRRRKCSRRSRSVDRRPEAAEPYRNVILLGLRQTPSGGDLAVKLLEHWTGQPTAGAARRLAEQLAAWQAWYAEQFPDALPAELPKDSRARTNGASRAGRVPRKPRRQGGQSAERRARCSRRPSASSATASTARAKAPGPISPRSASGSSGRKCWSRSSIRRTWCPTSTRARSCWRTAGRTRASSRGSRTAA